jgi:salicylate hydroxylase
MEQHSTIIAGAGIAGLSAALALGDRDVLMLEKSAQFSPIGAGLQLGPNAVRALQTLGAWEAIEPITSTAPEIHMWDGISGKLLKRLPLGHDFEQHYGAPYRLAHRAELHDALLAVVSTNKRIRIQLDAETKSVDILSDGVRLQTDRQVFQTRALIATDGVGSTVRQSLFENSAPVDAGETYHRALLPTPDVKGIAMECVNLWMFPHAHVVHYPVGKAPKLNLVVIAPKNASVSSHFANATDKLQLMLSLLSGQSSPWRALYAPRLPKWTRDGVLLLGDAAHAALPYLAQGAAMALEDAACLKRVVAAREPLSDAFVETANLRHARTQRLQRESMRAGRVYHAFGAMRHLRNIAIKTTPARAFAARLAWIYEFDS